MTITEVQEPSQESPSFLQKLGGSVMLLFVVAWVVGGIAALVMSLVCFGFSGTTTEKILGLALAFFLGPLYFIFYAVNKNYCRNLGANVTETVTQVVGGFRRKSE
jgi:ATP/ADP translocase